MTPDDLARGLQLNSEDLSRICAELQIGHSGDVEFSTQQALRISAFVLAGSRMQPSDPNAHGNHGRETPYTLSDVETANRGAGRPFPSLSAFGLTRLVFAQRFNWIRDLGSGGMGRVLLAFDRSMKREVAVKRLKNPAGWDDDLLERFVREAQLAGRLNHPNIMTVHDVFIDDEGPYLVLEFIDGVSLADRVEQAKMPWPEAIDLLLPICDAVTAAHTQGIIHRDIKPASILVSQRNVPKLGDFGIDRSLEGQGMTLTGAALGMLDYMAPEQMSSAKTTDVRADVYSLAATLYHLVTGESPQPISADELPVELRSIVLKALHRRPENRPASVLEFSQALAEVRRSGRVPELKPPIPPTVIAEPAAPQPQGFAAPVARAIGSAGQLHQQAGQALAEFDYAAAVELLERIPLKLRDPQQWHEAVAKRERVDELKGLIEKLFSEHDYRKLVGPVRAALELQPNRHDLKALLATLPDLRPRHGTQAGERVVVDIRGLEVPFRWCPPGQFKMGYAQVQAKLTKGWWMGETVVTQELYRAISNGDPSHFKGANRPVESVSWDDAQAFCAALTATLREEGILGWDAKAALPTEAQWEYACRAGTTTAYFFGSDESRLGQFAWFEGNAGKETHPVGTREANPWGLRDMAGNVWEWCHDWYDDTLEGGADPLGPAQGACRVFRGCCWRDSAWFCRSAFRRGFDPSNRNYYLGFRVCLSSD